MHSLSYAKVFVPSFSEGTRVTSYTKEYNSNSGFSTGTSTSIHARSGLVITIRSSNHDLQELFVLMNSVKTCLFCLAFSRDQAVLLENH